MFPILLCTTAFAWTGAIERAGDGSYLDPVGFPEPADITGIRTQEASVWVDVAVANWAYDKHVYVYWTVDDWATWYSSDAWYEGDYGDGYEQWGIELAPIGTLSNDGAWSSFEDLYGATYDILTDELTFDYAVAVEMGGSTWWDNNGGANYSMHLHRPELVDRGDGTTLDQNNHLRWTTCPLQGRYGTLVTTADCSGAAPATWSRSRLGCDLLDLGDGAVWRLPTATELSLLGVLNYQVPDLMELTMPSATTTERSFWSDSANPANRRTVLTVAFGASPSPTGALSPRDRTTEGWVRCVTESE